MRGTSWLRPARLRWLEASIPISMGFTPAGTIVPVPHAGHKLRGVTVPSLRHRGLAGVEPGYYRDSASYGECLLDADTLLVVAVAPPGPPAVVQLR